LPEDRSLFNRLRALFLRYASHHEARTCGVGLPRHRLRRVGNIESVCRVGDGLRLSGWASVEVLRFSWPDGSRDVHPDLTRHDLRRARGMGFEVMLPPEAKPIRVAALMPSGQVRHVGLQHPADPWTARTRRRVLRAFVRDMVRALPAFAAYALRRGDAQKQAIKAALGLMNGPVAPLLDTGWFGQADASAAEPPATVPRFTIVMPVHNGFDMLHETLDRVRRHTGGDWRIVIVDDASTDPRVGPFLRDWTRAQEGRAELVTLERNGGFVVAANHGLAMAEGRGGPVILLNSDAFVPAGWAERLLPPLSDPTVASVTPFSNAAEIFSAPLAGHSVPMSGDMADRLDDVARGLRIPGTLPSAPTGVGFCMAMSREWLDRVPRLDPAFGRGYGEEVDWCQRVRAMGGRHVGMPGLFILHAGGGSFGAEKPARVTAANAMISARYPRYDADVQDYLRHDPLRTARLTLAIAWAGLSARGPLPVYLAHSLGGGAEMALQREILRDLENRGAALVLRVGGGTRFVLELRLPGGRIDGATGCFEMIRSMLDAVPRLRIVYSCGVGDPVASELPALLLGLRRDVLFDRLEARLHDYFAVSPSYCLLGSDGRFNGPVSGDCPEPAHRYRTRDGGAVSCANGNATGAHSCRPATTSRPIRTPAPRS
jgi:GT2 family glycosyltransferase